MKDFLLSAEIFDVHANTWKTVSADYFHFSYRHTLFHEKPELRGKILIWNALLQLPQKSEEGIEENAKNMLLERKAKQPWGKTGGSFFKNPKEGAAGYYLELCILKGEGRGDAFFSEKHANFMMNAGNATQADILELARFGAKKVHDQFGITLVPEVRIIDEWGREVAFKIQR